jgi:hypothetical protein
METMGIDDDFAHDGGGGVMGKVTKPLERGTQPLEGATVLPQREEHARGSLAEIKLGIPLTKPLDRAPAQPLAFFTPPGESRKRSGEGEGGQQYWGQQPEMTHGIEDVQAQLKVALASMQLERDSMVAEREEHLGQQQQQMRDEREEHLRQQQQMRDEIEKLKDQLNVACAGISSTYYAGIRSTYYYTLRY